MADDLASAATPEAPSVPTETPEFTAPTRQMSLSEQTTSMLADMLPTEPDSAQSTEPGAAVDQPTEEGAEAEPTQEAESAEDAPTEETDPDVEVGEDGMAHVKTPRWKKVYATYKWGKELTEALTGTDVASLDPELLPPIADLKEAQDALISQRQFEADIQSGDADARHRVIERLNANPEAMAGFVNQLLPTLAQTNPAAYFNAARFAVDSFNQNLFQQISQQADPGLQTALRSAADFNDWWSKGMPTDWTSPFGPELDTESGTQQADPRANALALRERSIEQRERSIAESQQAAAKAVVDTRYRQIDTGLRDKVEAGIQKILEPLKDVQTPWQKEASALQLRKKSTEVMKSNAAGWQHFQLEFKRAVNTGDEQAIASANSRFDALLRVALGKLGPQAIKEISPKLVAENEQRHQQLRQASNQTGPATTGGAPPVPGFKPDFTGANTPSERTTRLLRMTS